MDERIVITGVGIATPWYVGDHPADWVRAPAVAQDEIPELSGALERYVPYSKIRRMCRFAQLALLPTMIAAGAAGYQPGHATARYGSILNTLYGPLAVTERLLDDLIQGGAGQVSPLDFSNTVMNSSTGQISMSLGLRGVSSTLIGSSAVHYARRLLRDGRADGVFVTGADEFNPRVAAVRAPESRICESAFTVLLERADAASARGARALAELDDARLTVAGRAREEAVLRELLESAGLGAETHLVRAEQHGFAAEGGLDYLGAAELAVLVHGLGRLDGSPLVLQAVQHGGCASTVLVREPAHA